MKYILRTYSDNSVDYVVFGTNQRELSAGQTKEQFDAFVQRYTDNVNQPLLDTGSSVELDSY